MRPTSKELIDGIAWVLGTRVMPEVDDEWAQSSLRSVGCLLVHLSVRVAIEGQVLFEDNADLRETLGDSRECLLGVIAEPWPGLRADIDAVLSREWREPDTYPSVASLGEENLALKELVDRLIVALHDQGDVVEPKTRRQLFKTTRAYLGRYLERERPMFFPAFQGTVF